MAQTNALQANRRPRAHQNQGPPANQRALTPNPKASALLFSPGHHEAEAARVSCLLSRVAHAGHVGTAPSICQKGGGGKTRLEGKTKDCGVSAAQRKEQLTSGWAEGLLPAPRTKNDVSGEESGVLRARPSRERWQLTWRENPRG